jgi:hypothetical protein
MMRTDSRSFGTNVGLRKLLMIPTTNPSMNNNFSLKVCINFDAFCPNNLKWLKISGKIKGLIKLPSHTVKLFLFQ